MLPFQCFHAFFFILFTSFELRSYGTEDTTPDVLLCRQCGHAIVQEDEIVNIKSSLALSYKNATILGQKGMLVQTFINPHGISFDVITASKANIHTFGEVHPEFSWFPGFGWKMAACPRCQNHLGWVFKPEGHMDEDPKEKYKAPEDYSFASLILARLIRQNFADSLIITPKVFQS